MRISRNDARNIVDYAKENLSDPKQIRKLSWNERKLLHTALIIINYSREAGEKITSDKKVNRVFKRIQGKKDRKIKPLKNIILRYIKGIANRYFGRISSSRLLSEIKKVKVEPKYEARTCVFKDGKIAEVKDGVDESSSDGEIQVKIFLGDLLKQDNVDAIVNPANTGLKGGGGVDGLIGKAAGESIYEELKKEKGKTGEAYITGSGKLEKKKGIKHVIHAIGPSVEKKNLLRNAYYNSLLRAHENNLESIAFPAISIGIFNYPPEKAARVALNAVKRFIEEHPETTLKDIRLVYFDDGTCRSNKDVTSYNACQAHLDRLFSPE